MTFVDRFLEEVRSLGELIVEWGVLILVALLVLILGRWLLRWVRSLTERLLGAAWLEGIWESSGIKRALEPSEQTPASIAATVLYAYLLVGLWLVISRILNLDTIEGLLERLLVWVPQLLLAAIIVIVAAAAASWTSGLVQPFAAERNVAWLTSLVRIAIIVLGVIFALDVVNITFAEDLVKILLAAAGIALAISFGVGGIDAAKEWWGRYGSPRSGRTTAGETQQPPHQPR